MSTHIERSALLPYTAHAMYQLVNDVKHYPEFLPWCSSSEVFECTETMMRARLDIAKAGVKHSFITRNTMVPDVSIDMRLEEGPFSHLHGVWLFKALGEKACKISLDMSFDYDGALVRVALGPVFTQAAHTMVDAFCNRARQLYG